MDDDPHRSPAPLPASEAPQPGLSIRFARGLIGTAAAGALTLGLVGWAPADTSTPAAPERPQSQSDDAGTDAEERLGVRTGVAVGGVRVTSVSTGSVAASAGLRAGEVVTAVDRTPVSSADELSAALAGYAHGEWVTLRSVGADGLARATVLAL
ncbi:PDZ domain-containing protein [Diaminobutyricimonas aerilata]|uniref:PDZ domain-containing protein n=1 Tax=Diaminobutyricimonas aerilata TaxID=1162967 RepID=UPI001B80C68C|nr:PDZ domain-containing protein [Diaminobutyricimonas aerilata]